MFLIYEDQDLQEAEMNLKEQVASYIQSLLDSTFENDFVQNVANKVDGYDVEWSANMYDNKYKQAKLNFIDSVVNTLFANFNK